MNRADVANLCLAMWRFERVRLTWEHHYTDLEMPFSMIEPADRTNFDQYVSECRKATEGLHLHPAEDCLKQIDLRCSWLSTTVRQMCRELETLSRTTIDELKRRFFVHVPAQKVDFVDNPKQFFAAIWDAYPSARENMASACCCYALSENTASVFHAMVVLQVGLEAFAAHLGLTFPAGAPQQWGNILIEVRKEVDKRHLAAQQIPNVQGQAKQAEIDFYAQTGMQFNFFKDAWRNRVAHGRDKYTDESALMILTSVKNFMVALSQRVKEPV
jgi:hypothetical protein